MGVTTVQQLPKPIRMTLMVMVLVMPVTTVLTSIIPLRLTQIRMVLVMPATLQGELIKMSKCILFY